MMRVGKEHLLMEDSHPFFVLMAGVTCQLLISTHHRWVDKWIYWALQISTAALNANDIFHNSLIVETLQLQSMLEVIMLNHAMA